MKSPNSIYTAFLILCVLIILQALHPERILFLGNAYGEFGTMIVRNPLVWVAMWILALLVWKHAIQKPE